MHVAKLGMKVFLPGDNSSEKEKNYYEGQQRIKESTNQSFNLN